MIADSLSLMKAAERLGVSNETVRCWVLNGKLAGYKLDPTARNSSWRVTIASIEAFEEKRQRQLDRT